MGVNDLATVVILLFVALVVIHNFHVFGVAVSDPDETDTELIVNSEAMLALTIPFERFQSVTGDHSKIGERPGLYIVKR